MKMPPINRISRQGTSNPPAMSADPVDRCRSKITWLLRMLGGICLLALVPFSLPRPYLDWGHGLLGLGAFPTAPVAEYLARSVCALCTFYGGLLLKLAQDVQRYLPIIRYQAVSIMSLSFLGIFAGILAGFPAIFVILDAVGCWLFLLPLLIFAAKFSSLTRGKPGNSSAVES